MFNFKVQKLACFLYLHLYRSTKLLQKYLHKKKSPRIAYVLCLLYILTTQFFLKINKFKLIEIWY